MIAQPWYQKEGRATNEDIRAFLEAVGFRPAPRSYYGWYRPADGVVIVDAKPDNFLATPEDLVPLDLQMAVLPRNNSAAAVSPIPSTLTDRTTRRQVDPFASRRVG